MDKTAPKPFVFVLMPFDRAFDDVYKLAIRPACKAAGTYCERVDDQIFTENIVERIWNQIAKAEIIVSDMTGKNPNVFYETGYAHALGKQTVLLTQNTEDIPFDLKQLTHVKYDRHDLKRLKTDLQKRIKYLAKHPEKLWPRTSTLEYLWKDSTDREGAQSLIPKSTYSRQKTEGMGRLNRHTKQGPSSNRLARQPIRVRLAVRRFRMSRQVGQTYSERLTN